MDIDRRYVLYAPVLVAATGLLFLKSIVYARLFSVEGFGTLNQALLVAGTFAQFASAGLLLLAHKQLPLHHTDGDQGAVDDLLAGTIAVFAGAVVIAAIAAGIALLAGWLESSATSFATLLYATAQFLFMLRLIDIKSQLRFLDHALLSGLRAIVLLTVGVTIAWLTRDVAATLAAEGFLTVCIAGQMFRGVSGAGVIRKILDVRAQRTWLLGHLGVALRLLWLNATVTLLYAIDRWAGIALLDDRQYGIFALGLIVVLIFEALQAVINVPTYPVLGRMIARGQQQRAFKVATIATLAVIALAAVFYLPFVLLLDRLVLAYLPMYVEATGVIKLAVIAGALRLADFYTTFVILSDGERQLSLAIGALICLAVVVVSGMAVVGDVRFDPERLALVTVAIALAAYFTNFAVALASWRRRSGMQPQAS